MTALIVFRINCDFIVCSCVFFVLFEPTANDGGCKYIGIAVPHATQQFSVLRNLILRSCLLVFGCVFCFLRRLVVVKSYLLLTNWSAAKQDDCSYLY